MKRYTIEINKKNNNNFSFRNLINNPSKSLDDLILSNLTKMNPYLGKKDDTTLDAMFAEAGFNTDDHILIDNRTTRSFLKGNYDTEFAEAAKFLSSYTPKTTTYIIDRKDIAFFEDEIQIGDILIPLYKLSDIKYYNTFTPDIKKTIINIYISINR
jgi:hypothetical protein